jgi:hypothetical protein
MKRVFISQPMRGKTDEEILAERKSLEASVKRWDPEAQIIDSYFADFNGNRLQFLAKSIGKLAEADAAIFGKGWEKMSGCKVEHLCCEEYGIEIIPTMAG